MRLGAQSKAASKVCFTFIPPTPVLPYARHPKTAMSLPCLLAAPRALAAFTCLATALVTPALAHEVLLHDTFADNSRLNEALPASARWTYSGESLTARTVSLLRYTSGDEVQLVRGAPAQPSMLAAYFTDPGTVRSLADGDSISLSFTLRLGSTPNSADAFRFGLFNSMGATRPTADMTLSVGNAADSRFLTAQGYSVWMNVGATSPSAFNLYKRNTTSASIPFNGPANALMEPANTAVLDYPLNQKVTHSMVITRSGANLVVLVSVNGRVVTRTDPVPTNDFAFDMIGLFNASGLLTSAALPAFFDDFVVEYRPAGGGDAGRVVLLQDTFADGDRKNQNLPDSAHWFYKGANTSPQSPDTQFRIPAAGFSTPNDNLDLIATKTGGPITLTAPFAAAPVTLAVGDALTARFSLFLPVARDAADGLRIALFDSQGVRPAGDFTTVPGSTPPDVYAGYRGYGIWLNPAPTGNSPASFRYRTPGAGAALFADDAHTLVGPALASPPGLAVGQFTRGSLKITRVSDATVRLEAAWNGAGHAVDVPSSQFTFDTFALHLADAAADADATLRIDDVTVLRTPAAPTHVASASTILSEDFADAGAWPQAGALATGGPSASVARGALGTIDAIMGVRPSDAVRLAIDSRTAAQAWSATLRSGPLAITNALADRALLSLAFDLKVSVALPVVVGIESFDGAGVRTGRIERLFYPAAPDAWQRFAAELDSFATVAGVFDPTAPALQLTVGVSGGTSSFLSWPEGEHGVSLDNVHLARPAYYVKPGGNDSLDGRTLETAFATPAKAVAVAQAGDIVVFLSDPTRPEYDYLINNETQLNAQGIYVTTSGRPAGWITFKNYPGHLPRIQTYGWRTFGMGSNAPLYSAPVAYIEFRGLSLRGVAHTPLAESLRGQVIGPANTNGIEVQGRSVVNTPHHIRFADNVVADAAGGGIIISQADYIQIENNIVYGNCLWTRYAGSGISILQGSPFDPLYDNYRFFILGNRVFSNECREPWVQINALSDGNGIIVDSLQNSSSPTRGSFPGRTLVQNNVAYDNGGGGIHTFRSDRVDIIHNTAYGNNQIVNYGQITHQDSNNGNAINNILASTDGRNVTMRRNGAIPGTVPSVYRNNLYVRGPGSPAPSGLPDDVGNVTIDDVRFVDAAAADFRLLPDSPALDFGVYTPLVPSLDHEGLPRDRGSAPDAGAHERQPAILLQPADTLATPGTSVTLKVVALTTFPGGLTYQWERNGIPIPGATEPTLTLSPVTPPKAGSYRVIITGQYETVISEPAVLSVKTGARIWTDF